MRACDDVDSTEGPVSSGSLDGVRVAHVGHFDPDYARNRIVRKALVRAGATVLTIADPRPFARRTPHLARQLARSRCDAVVVGFPGHADVASARLIGSARRVPVVFDAFVSLLETADDRGVGGASRRARARLATEDRVACRLADLVLLDTATHARYFEETFRVPARKLRRIWVGADDEVMTRVPLVAGHGFRVFVYASFIPLHGLEHVVEAAHLLERAGEPVSVDIVGTGATEAAVRALVAQRGVRSVTFLGARPYSELPSLIAASDVCLGIFGTSAKAGRVIPNKVFDALAVGRPVITADTPAAREVLTHGRDAWLCPPGDAAALAEALRVLRADVSLRAGLADRGHALFVREFSLDAIARELLPVVLGALGRSGSGA